MRGRAHLTEAEEAAFLEPFTEGARQGEMLAIGAIRRTLEARVGHRVARATAYNLLHRHGWRKPAPDKRRTSADPAAQDEWGKKRPKKSGGPGRSGRAGARSG
jgi:transposase